ncbi:RluA family pseudouridine synthase [Paenibacillus sp. HB172176]|uniref:RluA family pseudouridine synthase n=1 Tax=Paenibacillus sp. HB172176 TaxID=2493690 RepID=UPI0014390850|nr:RluA family pseudouridine synthase [Paenibacillus sp. HB172176]
MTIPVLYEDNHVLAVIKPPGVPSQEDESRDPDMLTLLKQDLKLRHNKPGNVFLGLLHRLDRPVGGAMIFAKTSKAASRMSESIRSRSFDKTYICVLQGIPRASGGRLVHYLRKDAKRNVVAVFDRPAPDAKEAVLSYSVIARDSFRSLAAVKLHTGRSHQIRAQMSHIGTPLAGDLKYGAAKLEGFSDIALWSASLIIPHPVTKEAIRVRSLPEPTGPWSGWTQQQLDAACSHFELGLES